MKTYLITEKKETGYHELAVVMATTEDEAWNLVKDRMLHKKSSYNIIGQISGVIYYYCV